MTSIKDKVLTDNILTITNIVREKYPTYYFLLTETPLFLSNDIKEIKTMELEQYFQSIEMQLKQLQEK